MTVKHCSLFETGEAERVEELLVTKNDFLLEESLEATIPIDTLPVLGGILVSKYKRTRRNDT